ncbi:hypothetical protein [Roseovarius atlanticus]|uniref:hypothetical protein n=1 Tax=Roseovarius atlanticus TaxID=1641875 RepID=UPI001C9524A7|nr:hypothetical protein [Roseovarius atlanticus]MBY5988825.1 hypothetical protein [Roseovarius atlanticus]MBY6124216.1 hypothetical protein [Roseovarius atlanticus]MBY6148711.1 hypothetical protein [Roseovarius atlanticus]
MFKLHTTAFVALMGASLSACTESPTTPSRAAITPDPIMTKYDSDGGGGGCPGGGQQGTAGGGEECLPGDYPQTPRNPTGQPRSGGGGNQGGGNQGGARP